jgi:sugar phosphate isomerase/epimerase
MLRAVRLALSTAFARAGARSPDQVIDVLLRAAPVGVELDATLPRRLLEELLPRLAGRREELPVVALENVCPAPDERRPGSRRAAELAALDRSEAAAALDAALETVRIAGELAAASGRRVWVLVQLGEVDALRSGWSSLRRAFLRGELDEEEALRSRLARERAARGRPHLDPARRALDRLARRCEASGVVLGIRNPSRHHGLPAPLELRFLLEDLAGGPVAPALDASAAHLADVMGLVPLADTLAAWRASPIAHLADACGPVAGLPPGRGELDLPSVIGALDRPTDAVFSPWPGLEEREVLAGVTALRALLPVGEEGAAARTP